MAFNGSLLRLSIYQGNPLVPLLVSEETTVTNTFSKDTFETTSKDSAAWRKRISSFKSGEITCEAFINYAPATGRLSYNQLFAIYDGTASVKCLFSTGVVGDSKHEGFYHVTNLVQTAATEQGATVSFTLTSDGAVTAATITA
jgi:predicted secreted protein